MGKYDLTYEEYINSRVVNSEQLEFLENTLGEKIPRDLLNKAVVEHTAEEFMRPYYCRELQKNITDINSHVSEQKDGVEVIKFNGEKFTMLVSAFGAYSHDNELSFKPKENGSKTLATSLITDEFMGHCSKPNKNLILLGYTKIPDESLYLCGPQDICSIHDNGTYEKRLRMGVHYLPSRQMGKRTSFIYNEYAMLRRNAKGEAISPTCVVSFTNEIDINTKKFAQKHNLPVVTINREIYKNQQQQKLQNFIKKDNPTPEELEEYMYGVVTYCEEALCHDLFDEPIKLSECIETIENKLQNITVKLNIDNKSKYWPVCEKFCNFHKGTTNDAIGPLFAKHIFVENDKSKDAGNESSI